MWRFTHSFPIILLALTSLCAAGNVAAQTLQLTNLPQGNIALSDFSPGFAQAYPALAINGFDCNAPGRDCSYGLGFKQIISHVAEHPESSTADFFEAIVALANNPVLPPDSRGAIKSNTLVAEARGFVANITLLLEANGYAPALLDLPGHAKALSSFEQVILDLASTRFNAALSDDAVKWTGPLGSLARTTDFFLTLEQAYIHFQKPLPALFDCNTKSKWLEHLQQQMQRVDDLGNTSVMDLQFIKVFGYDLAAIIRDISYDEVQAGNWPMKVHVAVGYAAIPYQIPETSCSSFIPVETYDRWLGRALRSAGGPDKKDRNHHWAYQTGGGQHFWAEGPFYFNYGLATVMPFWHAARIHNLLQENDDFTLTDPFEAPWLTAPLHAFADVVTPDGGTPPLEDGNKIPMEAAHLMAWDAPYGDDELGQKFAWIAAAQPKLPSADLWLHALAIPRARQAQPPHAEIVPAMSQGHTQQIILRRDGGTDACTQPVKARTAPCHYLLLNGESSDAILPGEGHEQSDQLQLLYYVDETSFLIDAGYDSAPGIFNSTWSDYRQHNVMAADRIEMPGGHGGLPGPVVGLSCTRYLAGLPLPTACMYAAHNEVNTWQHHRTGKVDVIKAALTIYPDARADNDEVIYKRILFFIDDPDAPYLIDINSAKARVDSMAKYIALEMNYLGNAPMLDALEGAALWHALWAAPDSLGTLPDQGSATLFIQALAVEADFPVAIRPDVVREIALSGFGNGEGVAVQRLSLSNQTDAGIATPSHTTAGFIQARPAGAAVFPTMPVAIHNTTTDAPRPWQLFSWQHNTSTREVALVRAAAAGQEPIQAKLMLATSGTWQPVAGYTTDGISFDKETGTVMLDADVEAGYMRLENTAHVASEKYVMQAASLMQNAPNPFTHQTTIQYRLDQPQHVAIEVFNMLGQRVDQLDNGFRAAGLYTVTWQPDHLPDGVYIYRLKTSSGAITRQMTLRR